MLSLPVTLTIAAGAALVNIWLMIRCGQARTKESVSIGDGGNEIGMGNLLQAVSALNITPAVTECDELIVADVSNWAAWGLAAMVSILRGENLLAGANPLAILQYLSAKGSVDGVTRLNTLTEDGLAHTEGEQLIKDLCTVLQGAD